MRVAVLSESADLRFLIPHLRREGARLDVVVWPDPRCLGAEVAVCWDPPRGYYRHMPNLRLVHSIAAGVDNVVDAQELGGTPVCRVIDPALSQEMLEYVLWGVLHFHRQFDHVQFDQARRRWARPKQRPASNFRVGVMGLGEIGAPVALGLAAMGYQVRGWSRRARALGGVNTYAGSSELQAFLSGNDVLVCLLPLTDATHGVLDHAAFEQLPAGAALIHCGRGEHLVEDDLMAALASGHLRGALVDVFSTEPLPARSPLWRAPGLVVTPHMAAMAAHDVVAGQILENIERLACGMPLLRQMDQSSGY